MHTLKSRLNGRHHLKGKHLIIYEKEQCKFYGEKIASRLNIKEFTFIILNQSDDY